MLDPRPHQIALLPDDRHLMRVLGVSEAEYRRFLRECINHSRIEPGKPVNFLIVPFLIQLAIGLALSVAISFLFRPKPPQRPAEIRQTSQPGQNVVNRSEYAPKAGFDSLQNVVELGSTIPVVYANREVIGGVTYGGVRVNTNLLWSQMVSLGGGQMLRAVFLISEGTIGEVDPSQFAFGDNVLGAYDLSEASEKSSRVTFYVSRDGGRLTSADRIAGRLAINDAGNSENAGAGDVFQIPGVNGEWTTDFCYSFKPSTQTQFGVYQLIGNGLGFRVNPSLRPAVVVKTEPAGRQDTRIRCNPDGVANAQREKYNTIFSSRSGVTSVTKQGSGAVISSGSVSLGIGDLVTYVLSPSSEANRKFIGVQEGPDHEETCLDVAQTVSGRQRGWDDALSIGELYRYGSALLICESRTPDNEIFVSEADQEPIGGGQQMTVALRCVRAGIAVVNGTEGTATATQTSHIFKTAIASFALPRPAQVFEIGFRSNLGIRISGICNFRDSLSQAEIDGRACNYFNGRTYAPGQSLELSTYQSGSFSGPEVRYSFFKIGYRVAGTDDEYTFASQCFGIRSLTQQSTYNYIRLSMPSLQRWEIRVEPVSGWEIRALIAGGNLEVLDANIKTVRTIQSGSGDSLVTISYSGEPVARSIETFSLAATRNRSLGVALSDGSDYADDWGKLAEAFVFEEIQASARSPEHEIVYVNLLAPNPNTPMYDGMALLGVNLRSSTEFSQLNQLSVYINKGINSVHTFPEVFYDQLTNQRYGVGSILSEEQIDKSSFDFCRDWTRNRRYFFDGAIAAPVNLRQWGSQTAAYFLLDIVIRNGMFALQPSFYFDEPEQITNLYTSGNILEDTFELAYFESDQRTPNRISVKWRQEKASGDDARKGLFPVIREVTVREAGTPEDAPLETIDLTDFCTSELHAIDVAKSICRTRRLVTHSIKFKTIPSRASLEVGRCFKLGLETIAYQQPNNGAIDSNGFITSTEPLEDGQYDVLLWRGSGSSIEETQITVSEQRAAGLQSAVFCIRQASSEVRVYKVQALGFDEDGNIDVEAIFFPLDAGDRSLIASGWDAPGNWTIEGAIGGSEADRDQVSPFTGVSITGPGSVTTGVAANYAAVVAGGAGSYSYTWGGTGVTFGTANAPTTTVTILTPGSYTISCTASRGTSTYTATKSVTAVQQTTIPNIGTVVISGPSSAGVDSTQTYSVTYTSKPPSTVAGNFIIGNTYQIVSVGTTDFMAIGASNNNVGTVFTATGTGSGSGTADSLSIAFISWSWSSPSGGSASIANGNAPSTKITFDTAATYQISCTISYAGASDSPQTQATTVTVS